MVPEAGLEPARYFYRGILSPLCLPIPPLGHINLLVPNFSSLLYFYIIKSLYKMMEAESGIEPELTALQAAA